MKAQCSTQQIVLQCLFRHSNFGKYWSVNHFRIPSSLLSYSLGTGPQELMKKMRGEHTYWYGLHWITVRVKNGKKIGLTLDPVWDEMCGYYRCTVTREYGTYSAITKLKMDFIHYEDFRQLDEEAENLITKEMMIQAMCATNTWLTEKEIREFIKNADCMKADKVNFNEYVRYLKYAERCSGPLPEGREIELEPEPEPQEEEKEEEKEEGEEGEKPKKEKKKKDEPPPPDSD